MKTMMQTFGPMTVGFNAIAGESYLFDVLPIGGREVRVNMPDGTNGQEEISVLEDELVIAKEMARISRNLAENAKTLDAGCARILEEEFDNLLL